MIKELDRKIINYLNEKKYIEKHKMN